MGMLKEFREFTLKGNVLDLAVGVIIGAAFGGIVSSVVDNVFMPLIGMLTGGVDFKSLSVRVGSAELKYGMFIQATVTFVIIAFFLFLVVKAVNKIRLKTTIVRDKIKTGILCSETLDFAAFDFRNEKQGVCF